MIFCLEQICIVCKLLWFLRTLNLHFIRRKKEPTNKEINQKKCILCNGDEKCYWLGVEIAQFMDKQHCKWSGIHIYIFLIVITFIMHTSYSQFYGTNFPMGGEFANSSLKNYVKIVCIGIIFNCFPSNHSAIGLTLD